MIIKKILICEDTPESIFTAIYEAWNLRYGHDNIRIQVQTRHSEGENLELFLNMFQLLRMWKKLTRL